MARESAGSTIQCMDQVLEGTNPRLTLCSPCVPGSKRAMPRSMQKSMPWW